MSRLIKRLSIRVQVILIAVIAFSGILSVMFLSYGKIAEIIVRQNEDYVQNGFLQTARGIMREEGDIARIIESIAYHEAVQQYLSQTDTLDRYLAGKSLERALLNVCRMNDGILGIVLEDVNGSEYRYNWVAPLSRSAAPEGMDPTLPFYSAIQQADNQPAHFDVSLSIQANAAITHRSGRLGQVHLMLNANHFDAGFDPSFQQLGLLFLLVDREGLIFSGSDPSLIGKPLAGVTLPATPSRQAFKNLGIELIAGANPRFALRGMSEIERWALGRLLLVIPLLTIPFLLLLRNLSLPISQLLRHIGEIRKGRLREMKTQVRLEGYAEITVVAEEINGMMAEIRQLTHRLVESNTRLYEIELRKNKSELAMLRSQINPHFLYNTLESVKSIATIRDVPEIRSIAISLASILRYAVKGADRVPLRQEIEIIRHYIGIQQIRFPNRFTITYALDGVLELPIMRMLLQPVVENAILHGLEPRSGPGRLQLSGREENGCLVLQVQDNGKGIEPETLVRMQAALSEAPPAGSATDSIGVLNVHSRIRLQYGQPFGLQIESAPESGTVVTYLLPLIDL